MAMQPSVTVMADTGDDDDEWGEEEEVVVWTNDIHNTADATPSPDSLHHGRDTSIGNSGGKRDQRGHPLALASVANLAISYNVVNVGLALKIMAKIYPSESTTDESLVSSAAILGMMAGQVVFGALGDCLGRQLALCCTLLVCFAGAAGSALLTFESGVVGADIFKQLLYWRVLLGVGAGGVYPLAATLARASSVQRSAIWCSRGREIGVSVDEQDTGSTAVALMFSMQGVGYLAAHVTGLVLLSFFSEASPVAWRLMLGLGAVLPLALAISLALTLVRSRRYSLVESAADRLGVDEEDAVGAGGEVGKRRSGRRSMGGEGEETAPGPARFWLSLRNKRRLLAKLVGTAGSWFLFDVTFYGNQLYEDDVLEAVFGSAEDLRDEAWQDSLVALVALPGYFVAVALIGRMGPRRVQVQGFVAMALLFALIGIFFHPLRRHAIVLMLMYSLTFFFSNFGPNSTTFMLPSLTFPDQVRSSLNGISAAAGKFGALLGSLMFKPAAETWGVGLVLLLCAIISLGGGFLTLGLVDSGEQQLILVGTGDADDDFDGGVPRQEVEMTDSSARASDGGRMAKSNGGGLAAKIRSRMAVSGKGGIQGPNGTVLLSADGAQLSPGPSKGRSPSTSKRKGSAMGMYARVGGETFEENSAQDSQAAIMDGDFREEEYQTLTLGRTAGVEGQMEQGGGGSRWGSDSDSSEDNYARGSGELVLPA